MSAMAHRVGVPGPAGRGISLGLSLALAGLLLSALFAGFRVHELSRTETPLSVELLPLPVPPNLPPPEAAPDQIEKRAPVFGGSPKPVERPDVSSPPMPVPQSLPPPLPVPADTKASAVTDGKGETGAGTGTGSGAGDGAGAGGGIQPARWVNEPGDRELWPFYPQKARLKRVSGSAVLRCQLMWNQHVRACRVVGQTPLGAGFGAAALAASPNFRIYPPKQDGKVIRKSWIDIELHFKLRPVS